MRPSQDVIYVGSDHAGFNLKLIVNEFLKARGYRVVDIGPSAYEQNDDYPDYAEKVCKEVVSKNSKGILICASGQGMDRAANKVPGIYASVCWNEESARFAKEHGSINVLCLPGKLIRPNAAKRIVDIWLRVPFSKEERHIRRVNKIKKIENRNLRKS